MFPHFSAAELFGTMNKAQLFVAQLQKALVKTLGDEGLGLETGLGVGAWEGGGEGQHYNGIVSMAVGSLSRAKLQTFVEQEPARLQ